MPGGSAGVDGWCYVNFTQSCDDITVERDCMDTFYCWWQFVNWNDPSQGGTCIDPSEQGYDGTFFEGWSPGCYVFDMNETKCNTILGCEYSAGACITNTSHNNSDFINENGINCTMINDSSLCNTIPVLSSCCEWIAGACTQNQMITTCWDDMDQLPEEITSCEDVSMFTTDVASARTLCQQVSGDPWYFPCEWDNSSNKCGCKADDIFGEKTQSFYLIDNKKTCQFCGGKWSVENYCEGNMSVPAGRCEQKGNDEKNCNKACFACEYGFDGTAHDTLQEAKEYCYGSKLGYCEFTEDSTAPNGYGFCRAKDEFKKGIASDCKDECGSCTYYGNPNSATDYTGNSKSYDTCKTPKCFCQQAYEFGNVKCKWVTDSNSNTGGYCLSSSEKTCADACDRCYTQTDCANTGRSALNATGSCEWQGGDNDGYCQKGGESSEVCWDAIDNDNDNLIDCADPGCYADSFCGFVSGDCFGWSTQGTCENAQLSSGLNCTWVSDPWGSWCDFPGADCWKYDGDQPACELRNATCEWGGGSGTGWCEQNWSVGAQCYMYTNNVSCQETTDCVWTEDTWCQGDGNTTDWCQNQGGWCDPSAYAPKNCWQYDAVPDDCNTADGCAWQSNDWGGSCDVDWSLSGNCSWFTNDTSCDASEWCAWKSDQWGGWCTNKFELCWSLSTEQTCTGNTDCIWDPYDQWSSCKPACFSPDNNENNCGDTAGCRWSSGWCMEDWSAGGVDCWNDTLSSDSDACNAVPECQWKNPGWCNPKGFAGGDASAGMGGGANTGMECWKYDGDEDSCTNSSIINITCTWMPDFFAHCEPDWSSNCWEYDWDYGSCILQSTCFWKNTTGNDGYCSNVFDQCWSNMSFSDGADSADAPGTTDEEECDQSLYCNWSTMGGGSWCEPSCFSASTEGECGSGCRWIDGWCNPPGMGDMFDGMEGGPPVPVAMDQCPETGIQTFVDICGAGLKDMDDTFGFGTNVVDFSQAGICNGQKVGMMGNFFGNGNETVKFYVYLDTNGDKSGGCSLSHNSSTKGYEFLFKYIAEWNENTSKAVETFNAYKCGSSGTWTLADITLSAFKQKMCGEIGGPMIAVNKADLEKFPTLYNSDSDIRIFFATANSTNNASSPTDTAGPGWITPGAIDFSLSGFFEYGADSAMFEDIMKSGYVEYEDCYNTIDDDNDGNADCSDWDCQFASHCANTGVNQAGYEDTSMPRIIGMRLEEYTDSALVMYDTNKPTNGTLEFYGNDSTCGNSSLNETIYDTGIINSNVREFKLWHYAQMYNDGGLESLGFDLIPNTNYYYKLKICDYSGKCSVSACASLRTAESASKCGYCNFVSVIKPPAQWNIYYDLDTDNVYEHWQGHECGPNAGMKTNYTTGRRVNIKMNNSDGGAMWFFNVTLTKTGLTSDTRDIEASGSLIYNEDLTDSSGNKVGIVGMLSSTRDKIVNNLHPETCNIRIPSDGTCDELWHCDDSGDNCVDMTNQGASLISSESAFCTWKIPFCEFSTWASGEPGTPAGGESNPPGGGGGGGGGAAGNTTNCTEEWTCTSWSDCVDNIQTRTCTDNNDCGTIANKPAESQVCEPPPVCGNDICEAGETTSSCPEDCPLISSPDACTPGERRCYGNTVQECVSGGDAWAVIESCRYGCQDAVCRETPETQITDLTPVIIPIVIVVVAVVIVVSFVFRRRKVL